MDGIHCDLSGWGWGIRNHFECSMWREIILTEAEDGDKTVAFNSVLPSLTTNDEHSIVIDMGGMTVEGVVEQSQRGRHGRPHPRDCEQTQTKTTV